MFFAVINSLNQPCKQIFGTGLAQFFLFSDKLPEIYDRQRQADLICLIRREQKKHKRLV